MPRRSLVTLLLCLAAGAAFPAGAGAVVGGSQAAITSFPFQVALYSPSGASPANGFFCGGVVLDATHVATAAHCVLDESTGRATAPQDLHVLAGTDHLNSTGDPAYPATVKDVPAAATSFDPGYDPDTNELDVAVITLSQALYTGAPHPDGTATIAPVPLISAAQAATYADDSQSLPATVSGWGDMDPEPISGRDYGRYPQDLQAASVHLVPTSMCTDDYGVGSITPQMLCAGEQSGGVDACFGDSGGPLVVSAGSPASPPTDDVLAGLVDWGAGCAQPGYPGVYSRVADASIQSFLTSSPPQAPQLSAGPSVTGTIAPGQTVTCNPGSWSGATSLLYQFGRDDGTSASALTGQSPSPTYVVRSSDAGTRVFCEVRAANAGGYGYADSQDVTVAYAAPAPPVAQPASTQPSVAHPPIAAPTDTEAPVLRVAHVTCLATRCLVNVAVDDPAPSAGVRTVLGTLRWTTRRACRRHGRRTWCLVRHAGRAHAEALGGDRFLVAVTHLRPGAYDLTLVAVDRAGHRQRTPVRLRLRVLPRRSRGVR